MRTLHFLLLLTALLLISCDRILVDSQPTQSLLPLKVGNRWILTRTVTDASGDTLTVEPDTVTVASDTTLNGERWFEIAGSSPESRAGFGGYNAVRSDGVWFRAALSTPAYLQYAYPAEMGLVYPYAPHRYTAEATVIGTAEVVSGTDLRGVLYTISFDSLRAWPYDAFSDDVPPLRRLLVPGIGFGEYETQWWEHNADGELALLRKQSWRLVRFESAA